MADILNISTLQHSYILVIWNIDKKVV